MAKFDEQSHMAEAPKRLEDVDDPRLKEVMTSFTRHMFAFVNDVRPTEDEWMAGIDFLTEIGQKCDDKRQEFILFSDIVGVSMLVDYIGHGVADGATESSVLGPFYRENAPEYTASETISLDQEGEPVEISGRVTDEHGVPISDAKLDVWQTAANGLYEAQDPNQPDYNLRGVFRTDVDGRYELRTIKPVSYSIPNDGPVGRLLRALGRHSYRPAHVHFIVSAEGYEPVVSQIFTDDDAYLKSDAVFGVKDSLVVHYEKVGDIWRVTYDFSLKKIA